MGDKIVKLWELLEPRRFEQGICFDHYSEKWGWRCSVKYSIPVVMFEGFGGTPEEAIDDLTKNVEKQLNS